MEETAAGTAGENSSYSLSVTGLPATFDSVSTPFG